MVHQMKTLQLFACCWIIQRLQLLSAFRDTLMLGHFQKKLDVFQSDMELLKFDVSNIQHSVSNLNKTCQCKENDRYFENADIDANSSEFVNRQFTNNLTGIVQTSSRFSDSDKTSSTRLLKAFKDEKKHTRAQLDKMLGTIKQVHNQETLFQTEFEERYNEHEKQVKQMESSISKTVEDAKTVMKQQTDTEIKTLKHDLQAVVANFNAHLTALQQEKTVMKIEFDNKHKADSENIDQLKTVLKKNEQEMSVMREYISNVEKKMDIWTFLVDKQKYDNCLNPSDNWIPSKELGSSFLVIKTLNTWDGAKEFCYNRCSYLVELTTNEKQTFIKNLYTSRSSWSKTPEIWTGGNDLEKEGEFKWYHSKLSINGGFTNWRKGEPNNFELAEDCVAYNFYDWNDLPCNREHEFVCEKRLINTSF